MTLNCLPNSKPITISTASHGRDGSRTHPAATQRLNTPSLPKAPNLLKRAD